MFTILCILGLIIAIPVCLFIFGFLVAIIFG